MLGSSQSRVFDTLYSQHDSLFADEVMGEADWTRHRRATVRYRLQPLTLARVMLGYLTLLLWVAVLSVAVGVYDVTLVKMFHWPMLSIQSVQTFFSSITFCLTLLLVFKTNSSYARWWEARKDLGQLVSFAHNITRQAVAYFPPHQAHLVHALARWTSSAMWVVKAMVRSDSPLKDELQGVLLPQELDWLLSQRHKPLAVGQALSVIIAAADIDPMTKHRMDAMLTLYTFEFGACGRIYNTAIPSAYTRHTARFLLCYIFIGLPLMLWPLAGWSSPVLAVLIAFLLLGVENIGAQVEEPFHVMAFDAFCAAVQKDIQTILLMHQGCLPSGNDPTGSTGCIASPPIIGGLTGHDGPSVQRYYSVAPCSSQQGPTGLSASLAAENASAATISITKAAAAADLARNPGGGPAVGLDVADELVHPSTRHRYDEHNHFHHQQPHSVLGSHHHHHQQQQQQQAVVSSGRGSLPVTDSKTCLLSVQSHSD